MQIQPLKIRYGYKNNQWATVIGVVNSKTDDAKETDKPRLSYVCQFDDGEVVYLPIDLSFEVKDWQNPKVVELKLLVKTSIDKIEVTIP